MSRRLDRVNALLQQEISKVLSTGLNDPRMASVVSVIRVATTSDLRRAKVFVSVLGGDDDKRKTIEALTSAAGFIHRALRPNLNFKNVPVLAFELDESIERGAEMLELIREILPEDDPVQEPQQ